MIRGPKRWTVAVRRANGEVETTATQYQGWAKRWPLLGKPFFRGAVMLLESMIIGLKALNFSAEIAAQDEKLAEKLAAEKAADASEQKSHDQNPPSPEIAQGTSADGASKSKGIESGQKPALGFWAIALSLTAAFGLAMVIFVALPHVASVFLGIWGGFDESSTLFHFLDGIIKFALFIAYVWGIGFLPDIARVYAYHGAEHQAIYTFEAGEELTVEMAARHSPFHPRCGTAFIFLVLALSIIFFAAVFPFILPQGEDASFGRTVFGVLIKILFMLPVAGLAYEVTRLAGRSSSTSLWRLAIWPGLLLQRLTTKKPSQDQLEVALVALKNAVA